MTLGELMEMRGIPYISIFGNRAEDIYFDNSERIFYSLGFIVNHCHRFEFEIPEERPQTFGSYPITNGVTSGGYTMKQANQYRIYFDTIRNMPKELKGRLQNDNNKRITGSKFIEACYHLGFVAGCNQDTRNIIMNIQQLMTNQAENQAFDMGRDL